MNRRIFLKTTGAAVASSLAVGAFSISNDPWIVLRRHVVLLDDIQDIARQCGLEYMPHPVAFRGDVVALYARTCRLEVIVPDEPGRIRRSTLIEQLKWRLKRVQAGMLHSVGIMSHQTSLPWDRTLFKVHCPFVRIVTRRHLALAHAKI